MYIPKDDIQQVDNSSSEDETQPSLLRLVSEHSNELKAPLDKRTVFKGSKRLNLLPAMPNSRGSSLSPSISQLKQSRTSSKRSTTVLPLEKDHIIFRIQDFSRKHKESGASGLADKLIKVFTNFSMKERALKEQYEELSELVRT